MHWYGKSARKGWRESIRNLRDLKFRLNHPKKLMNPAPAPPVVPTAHQRMKKANTSRFSQNELESAWAILPVAHSFTPPPDPINHDPAWIQHRGWRGLDFRVRGCVLRRSRGFFQWNIQMRNRFGSPLNFAYALSSPAMVEVDPIHFELGDDSIKEIGLETLLPCGSPAKFWIGEVYYHWRGELYPMASGH
jgi:hypothetical protein